MSSLDLAARMARLSPEQRAQLLRRLRQAPAAGPPPLPPVTPRPADAGALPLSFAQQRLWFLAQLDPEDTSYNICRTLELRGPLHVPALEAALEALLHRHEALRTTFPSASGQPTQHIAAPAPLALPLTDLRAHPPAEREALRRQLIDQLARRPFDLAQGPLLRVHLLRLAADVHVLVLAVHHIAMDGWSLGVLLDELAAIYGAHLRGEPPALPALPVQYADHALWERHWLQGAVLDEQLAYWRQQLAGAPPLLELSVRPRPVRRSLRGAHCVVTLPLQPARAVTALAQQESASAFMALLGAFLVLLYLTTGEEDLVVGTPIAHRTRPETERLIGYFANTLALRVRVGPRASFRALLRSVRAACLDAYAHQDVPFEKLVEELRPERSLGHTPIFQLMFQLEDSRVEPRPLAGLDTRLVAEDTGASAYDVTLGLAWRPEGLVADAQYSTDRFEEEEVRRLLEHLGRVLELVAAEPDLPVADLRLLSAAQRRQVLVAWNDTARPLPSDRPLHARWAEQVARSPEAPAAICGEEVLGYRQLDRRAAELAHALRELGVRPGTCVALCFPRSLEALVSLLAILKAGAHYLPLDPALPVERLRWLAGDSAARLVITSSALRARCEALSVPVLVPEAPGANPEARPAPAPEVKIDPLELAYVLYTSGSTGRPKGVMVTHHALVSRCEGLRAAYRLRADDRVLHFASLAFDVAAEELFPTWLAGACVVVWPHPQPPPPSELEQFVARHRVSVLNLPASYWHLWVDELPEACHALPPTVRLLVTGSETVSTERLARWRRLIAPQPEWINAYGPTEATITATMASSASPGFRPEQVPLSIGRPLANTTAYVLDEQLEPTPPGVAGELYLGGASLARGYLGRPELTAERFLPHPHATEPGARLYRTGDRARLWPDGAVQLLGRADDQIKLRGFRIEPGEVEAALARQPGVRAAAVVPRPHPSGEPRLVAYLVCDGPAPTPAELHAWLSPHLPEHMVPALAVRLDALPRTAGGKVDRQALPAPADEIFPREAFAAPTSPTEKHLAEIWCEVLGIDQVGIHDSFFALGGHSLFVVRLVARIHRRLGVELSTRSVFESPTIAQQAEHLARSARARASADDPAERELVDQVAALSGPEVTARLAEWSSVMLEIRPTRSTSALAGDRRELADRLIAQHRIDAHPGQPLARRTSLTAPATVAQQLQWDFHQRGNHPTLGIHAAALAIRGPLDVQAMHQAVADLIERQASLRTVFAIAHGRLTHTAQPRGPALDVVDLSRLPAGERTAEARRQFELISRPHDLTREVFRARLLRQDDHDHLLFLAPHHIAVDGFSWSVLEADLAALYRTARGTRGAPATAAAPGLAPLELACRDFCFWQTGLEDRPVGRAQLAFWGRAVAGYQGLELPGDRRAVPRGSVELATDTYEAGSAPFVLDGPRWNATLRLCSRLGCTPYVAITSGFLLLLARWSGRDDVCVLSSNFHRNRPGSEAVIGNFVTPYPLRASFDDRDSLEAVVRHCHDRALAHREHGHVAPRSALAAWPEWTRYNVNYLIDAHGDGALDLGAASVERLPWSALARRTTHDLALFARQGARGVRGDLVYNAERFSPALMARAAARLDQLIDAIANEPSHRVGALPRAP